MMNISFSRKLTVGVILCASSSFLALAFHTAPNIAKVVTTVSTTLHAKRKTLVKDESRILLYHAQEVKSTPTFINQQEIVASSSKLAIHTALLSVGVVTGETAVAVAATGGIDLKSFQSGLTPETFQPVCSTSDGLYRILQQTAQGLVGPDNFAEYGPLIASGLLRVRLELCVVESFFSEAVGPFIRDNGLSWVLPLHETVETFLAGGIFALATTFILIGSTKLVTVIITYIDFLIGLPSRLVGGFTFDRAQGKPVTLDIGFGPFKTRLIGPPEPKEGVDANHAFKLLEAPVPTILIVVLSGAIKFFGQTVGLLREILEAVDSFVGRYLVLWASAYLIIKFLHFKVFPDFPSF